MKAGPAVRLAATSFAANNKLLGRLASQQSKRAWSRVEARPPIDCCESSVSAMKVLDRHQRRWLVRNASGTQFGERFSANAAMPSRTSGPRSEAANVISSTNP